MEAGLQGKARLPFLFWSQCMSHQFDDARVRCLIRYHYQRNRHLSVIHDAEDLFQDTWIDIVDQQPEPCDPEAVPATQEQVLRQAVSRAAERAFGKLKKRSQRGSAAVVQMEHEPADCVPDHGLVMDLKQQIESLPADERLVIEMLRSGYDGTEIATQLKLSPQAVTRRKQRALERLRQALGESV